MMDISRGWILYPATKDKMVKRNPVHVAAKWRVEHAQEQARAIIRRVSNRGSCSLYKHQKGGLWMLFGGQPLNRQVQHKPLKLQLQVSSYRSTGIKKDFMFYS
ncbi:hypothetical protein TNCT_260331 [Trichonephila clavata]|uniref:Uncharacterized protein n=1 Tax=Trichonephila clavata TaxID=2740835 RepID=A0A8X6HUG1_TRICU|nr:hypothetical protein TNCT_260331 [Trichonephila clavata]